MPYITKDDRDTIEQYFDLSDVADMIADMPSVEGALNYLFTRFLDEVYFKAGKFPVSYAKINSAVGVLECCKQEFYDRVARPYEDRKISFNGDVYAARSTSNNSD